MDIDRSDPAANLAYIARDLEQAISLASPDRPIDPVSTTNASVLAAAHSHRGYLLLLASKSETNRRLLASIPSLKDVPSGELEELASKDLAVGGRFGNETARQLAVKTNPYAKLCGSIVKEALQKEIAEYYQGGVQDV